MTKRPKPQTYEQQFLSATSKQRNHMKERGQAKYSRDGKRLLQPAVPVEFSLEEYRAWVLAQFGDEWGSRACFYGCGRLLTPETFVPDHFKALSRGGSNTLSNLVVACPSCNDQKGELDGEWFQFLLKCVAEMPESQRSNILERLAKSEKAAASVRSLRGQIHNFRNSQITETQEQI